MSYRCCEQKADKHVTSRHSAFDVIDQHTIKQCNRQGLTNEVEAEDTKSHCAKEGEGVVQISEQGVQEWCDWWVHKDIEQDLQQPADAENHPHHTEEKLEVKDDDRHCPCIVRIRALHRQAKQLPASDPK